MKSDEEHYCRQDSDMCRDISPMILSVNETIFDDCGYAEDSWRDIEVNYCPFCGLKSGKPSPKKDFIVVMHKD